MFTRAYETLKETRAQIETNTREKRSCKILTDSSEKKALTLQSNSDMKINKKLIGKTRRKM